MLIVFDNGTIIGFLAVRSTEVHDHGERWNPESFAGRTSIVLTAYTGEGRAGGSKQDGRYHMNNPN